MDATSAGTRTRRADGTAADASFAVYRGDALVTDDSDGERLAETLGLPRSALDHVEGAGGHEQRRARAMNNALWPATLGYYLEQLMAPVFDDSDRRWGRRWFVENVRGRGSAPAFRIGGTPYGVLPVTALAATPLTFSGSWPGAVVQVGMRLTNLYPASMSYTSTPTPPYCT